MTEAPTLNFKRGGDAASEEAAKNRGGSFRRTVWFNLQDGESAFLRYLTDWNEIYFVKQHQSYPTKPKPADFTGDNWPDFMPTVCRYDDIFGGFYKDDYPCDHTEVKNKWGRPFKPTVRNWAVAILREEVVGTQEMVTAGDISADMLGKRLGFKDQTREVEVKKEGSDETETVIEPAFVIVNMADSNYFDGLGAMNAAYGTICDRDYYVQCKGKDKDKSYTHAPMAETPALKPGTEKWTKKYVEPLEAAGEAFNIEKIIAERASDEYMAKFIDRDKAFNWKAEGGAKGSGKSAPDVPETGGDDVDEERLAALRNRVRDAGGAQAPSASLADVD